MSIPDDPFEQLFSKVSRRPVPDDQHAAIARESLKREWRTITARRRSQKRLVNFAVAATVVVGMFALLNTLRVPVVETVQVASIQKSFGSIFFVGEQSVMTPAVDLATVNSGQRITTGKDSGIALTWNSGGSLRLHADTTIEFKDEKTVYLESGQLYFDSRPSALMAGTKNAETGAFLIETVHGVVTHVGTQFMTKVDGDVLQVSVREGRVSVANDRYPMTAEQGDQVSFSGQQRPLKLRLSEFGEEWRWIGRTTPIVDVDGRPIDVFLNWVSRELGREIVYSDAARAIALTKPLFGTVDQEPEEALRLRMLTTSLDWHFEEGKIYVEKRH